MSSVTAVLEKNHVPLPLALVFHPRRVKLLLFRVTLGMVSRVLPDSTSIDNHAL